LDELVKGAFAGKFNVGTVKNAIEGLDQQHVTLDATSQAQVEALRAWCDGIGRDSEAVLNAEPSLAQKELSPADAVAGVQSGRLQRAQIKDALRSSALLHSGGDVNVNRLRLFATSPPARTLPSTLAKDLTRESLRLCETITVGEDSDQSKALITRRLERFCARKACEYCKINMQCMVLGCTNTPITVGFPSLWDSLTPSKTTFRCAPGIHLCNAHGLTLLHTKASSPKKKRRLPHLRLDDGRVVQNVHCTTADD